MSTCSTEKNSFSVPCFLVTALSPDSQMHTGIRMLHRQFKCGYVTAESEIGGQMQLHENEFTSFSSGGCAFTFIFIK